MSDFLIAAKVDWRALESAAAPNIATKSIGEVISGVLPFVFAIAGFLLLFYLLYSGFQYMTSSGDPKKLESAKQNITYSIVGFIVIFVAYWAVQVLGLVLGIEGVTGWIF